MHRAFACIVLAGLGAVGCAAQPTAAFVAARLHPNLSVPLQPVKAGGFDGVIFPETRALEAYGYGNVTGYWTPSKDDLDVVERKLKPYLEHVWSKASATPAKGQRAGDAAYQAHEVGRILEHYGEYRRQYVGILVGRSKRILVNSFPEAPVNGRDDHSYWTSKFVEVNDGGYWYWSVQYDVERAAFLEFASNGYA